MAWRRRVWRAGVDLVFPLVCGGCGRPSTRWCARCAAALADAPVAAQPRVDPSVPVWALGRYRGPRRQAIVALKEHRRRDLVDPLGSALAQGIRTLAQWGEMPGSSRLHLVPAPTRPLSARRRGGDPVTAIAAAAAPRLGSRVQVTPVLVTASSARDSAGLDARARQANLVGAVGLRDPMPRVPCTALLIDDVLTTGATAAESVRVLGAAGITVAAVVVLAAA